MTRARRTPKRSPRRQPAVRTYTWFDEISASPVQPLAPEKQAYQLARMRAGLQELCSAPNPSTTAWRVVSDAANLLETMVVLGYAQDPDGLVQDVVRELALAAARHLQEGVPIRLSGTGIRVLTDAINDYAEAIAELPARDVIRIHRATEARIADILAGKRQPHDVEVVNL